MPLSIVVRSGFIKNQFHSICIRSLIEFLNLRLSTRSFSLSLNIKLIFLVVSLGLFLNYS